MDDPGCLMAVPNPQGTRVPLAQVQRRVSFADHCGSRGVPCGRRPRPVWFLARDVALLAGGFVVNPCDTSRHGLAASRLGTLGSGALRCCSPPRSLPAFTTTTSPNATWLSVAPLPVRLPGPRITATGCCHTPDFRPATLHSQQVDAAHLCHEARSIMSAPRARMPSTPLSPLASCAPSLQGFRRRLTASAAVVTGRRTRPRQRP